MWPDRYEDRLSQWHQLRQDNQINNLETALLTINDWWQQCPWTPYYLHWDDLETWPDPWDLLADNHFCNLAKALGIVYTLHLSEHGTNLEMSIRVYQDPASRGQYNLAWIDQGKYVLNFISDEIVNRTQIPKELKFLVELSSQDLKLDSY